MHVRLGHVTNSSSTNHILMWKGAKDDLRRLLLAHAEEFPTSTGSAWLEVGEVTVDEIVNAFCDLAERIEPAETFIAQLESQVEHYEEMIQRQADEIAKKIQEGEKRWINNILEWEREYLEEAQRDLEESQGFDWRIEVGFGDNQGDYCGGALGNIMDYEGRHINISEPGFRYKTEQNR